MTLQEAHGRLDALLAQVGEITTALAVDDAVGADDAEAMEAMARANRDGERGPDWQVLQARIDRGDTTLDAILAGEDPSPEAARVVARSRQNLARVDSALEDTARQDPDALDPHATAEQLRATLDERMAELRRHLGQG